MYASTGFRNQSLGNKVPRELLKDFVIKCYGGDGIPANADAAVLGTLLATLTISGATSKVAQVMRITPVTAGTTGTWSVTVGKDTVIFTDDGTPTAAEICTGLTNLLNVMAGGAITTPPGVLNTTNDGIFTVTNNGTTIDITSAVAGVSIEVSSTCTGAGNTLTTSTQTDHRYGIRWEAYTDIASGILEKLASDTINGAFVANGTILYGRICADDDVGGLSTSLVRLQLTAAVANAELELSHVDGVTGEVVTVTGMNIYLEES